MCIEIVNAVTCVCTTNIASVDASQICIFATNYLAKSNDPSNLNNCGRMKVEIIVWELKVNK